MQLAGHDMRTRYPSLYTLHALTASLSGALKGGDAVGDANGPSRLAASSAADAATPALVPPERPSSSESPVVDGGSDAIGRFREGTRPVKFERP